MDIELLSKMVGELILDHDEVGLPGLGSFVAEIVPASFSDRGYTINPPYRRLTFVPGRCEDTSLVQLYADSNGVDTDQAKAILQHFLTEIRKVLQDRKVVAFPKLGRLRATRENNFFFVTDEDLDIYPEGFGLQPVSLKNHVDTAAEVENVVSTLAAIVQPGAPMELVQEEEPVPEVQTVEEPVILVEPVPEEAQTMEPEKPVQVEEVPSVPEVRAAGGRKFRWWMPVLIALEIAVIALAAFVILAHTAPDFIDSILYTPEELRIINY